VQSMGLPAAATFSTGAGELYRLAARTTPRSNRDLTEFAPRD